MMTDFTESNQPGRYDGEMFGAICVQDYKNNGHATDSIAMRAWLIMEVPMNHSPLLRRL
jgi:hypothetical protein